MALTDYITIDSKKYRVLVDGYEREMTPPKTVRRGVLGNTIVSMGVNNSDVTTRQVLAIDYSPITDYGTISDLQSSAEKTSVTYVDHISGESTIWGQGSFNITLLSAKVLLLPQASMPASGFYVLIEWQKVLS